MLNPWGTPVKQKKEILSGKRRTLAWSARAGRPSSIRQARVRCFSSPACYSVARDSTRYRAKQSSREVVVSGGLRWVAHGLRRHDIFVCEREELHEPSPFSWSGR